MALPFFRASASPDPAREQAVAGHLPYIRHLTPTAVETRDGKIFECIHLRGMSFETADTEELNYRKAVRETMLRGLASSRFGLYHHIVRRRVRPEIAGAFPDPFSADLDALWRERLKARSLFTNELFLTLVRRPLQGRLGFAEAIMRGMISRTNEADRERALANELDALRGARESIISALEPYGARLLSTYEDGDGLYSEPLEFLRLLYSGELRRARLPVGELRYGVSDRRVSFGVQTVEFAPAGDANRSFAAVLSLKDYPVATSPGLLDDILRLPLEMTITQSFGFVDRQQTLDRMNTALRRMRSADDEAFSLRRELSAAKDDVAASRVSFGEHHLSLCLRAPSSSVIDSAVAQTISAFTDLGMIAVREDINLEASFWSQFPANFSYIGRRSLVSSASFASLASLHNFSQGHKIGTHWSSPISLLETTSAGPYYFNFHAGDLGNFTLIGPSGSGKTVVLGFLLAQAQRLQPRTVYFDKDRGAEIFLRALGGRYDALRPGEPSGLNPLLLADEPSNRQFLTEWVAKLVTSRGEALTPDEVAQIRSAVDANFGQPAAYRRLRYFSELLRGGGRPAADDLFARLEPWHGEGSYAWLFDNAHDSLDLDVRTVGFDMTRLLDNPAARSPTMLYLFHRVEQRLDGHPTIIVIDEGWKALDDDVFVKRIQDWEKTIRKRNGIIGFATQSASDALSSRISSAIIEQAATQIFMVNPKAQAREYCDGFGLTLHELELIKTLPINAHCFLVKSGSESAVVRLNLRDMPDVLTVLSGRERSVRKLDELRSELGDAPADWLPRLLESAHA